MDVVITSMNGLLIVGTTGLALWLWTQSLISVGAIALATGLVIRIVNMSGWIMWVVNGIFRRHRCRSRRSENHRSTGQRHRP